MDALDGLSACECPVCFNNLSESRAPMSMPCGHTLCQYCVDQLVSKATNVVSRKGNKPSATFQCPLCREWVNQHSVTLNVTLRDLIVEISQVGVARGRQRTSALNVNYTDISFGVCLDRGAFGEVYRGSWSGNDVAIKVLVYGQLTNDAMRAFQREVFVMNCLRHPNVVLLMGACQTPPKLAILMEYVAGGSLHKLLYIDKVPLVVEGISNLGIDICRGLQYLHSINILHRDLKSKNVLLTGMPPLGSAKLCDFGLARMRLESATMTGNIGTVHWSAPEVLLNQRYQFSADVYSFGMVLYEMACGQVPFHNMMPVAVVMAVGIQKQQPVIPNSAHPKLAELIKSCISWEPSGRPSIISVLTTLSSLLPPPSLQRQKSIQEYQAHSDSLGVVFVSATDTADVLEGQRLGDLEAAVKMLGLTTPEEEVKVQLGKEVKVQQDNTLNDVDYSLAMSIFEQDKSAQLKSDRELAEQLQMKEHAYRVGPKTSNVVSKTLPMQVLDSIRNTKGLVEERKVEEDVVVKTGKKLKAVKAKKKRGKVRRESTSSDSDDEPPIVKSNKISHAAKTKSSIPLAKTVSPSSLVTKTGSKFSPAALFSKITKSKAVTASHDSDPPPPPPPPLITHPPKSQPMRKPITSSKRKLLEEVRTAAPRVSKKLRPTETIEKRAFRVGRVVDGYSSEASQYTFQNLIATYNKKLLHHVSVKEPQPAYPVGRVLPTQKGRQGSKVKRLSSLIELRDLNGQSELTTPTKRLHPQIKQGIEAYKYSQFRLVNTEEKNWMPTAEDISREKWEQSLQEASEKKQVRALPTEEEMLKKDRERAKKLHPVIRDDIRRYNVRDLDKVQTEVKQWMPSAQDILREKREKSKKLHPAILDDIESYNVRDLDNAKTVVKQWMPTAEEISQEKQELEEAKRKQELEEAKRKQELEEAKRKELKQWRPTAQDIKREKRSKRKGSSSSPTPDGFW